MSKFLSNKTIVITGASSGHGLATARMAARAGARVLLVSRDGPTLERLRDGIRARGGNAESFAVDVGEEGAVVAVVAFAVERFGGFDVWVNNAGTAVYADLLDLPTAEHRRIFDTNYWGVVHGSLAAARHFTERRRRGTIVNVGSVMGDLPSPVLSAYSASKHAVKGFTDSLRLELRAAGAPVDLVLVKPSAIDTPFPDKAGNRTGFAPTLPPPRYAPEVVARAILRVIERPRRSLVVGGVGKLQVLAAVMAPSLYDRIAAHMALGLTERNRPRGDGEGDLREPAGVRGQVSGGRGGRRTSLFTWASGHRGPLALATLTAVVTGTILVRSRSAGVARLP